MATKGLLLTRLNINQEKQILRPFYGLRMTIRSRKKGAMDAPFFIETCMKLYRNSTIFLVSENSPACRRQKYSPEETSRPFASLPSQTIRCSPAG